VGDLDPAEALPSFLTVATSVLCRPRQGPPEGRSVLCRLFGLEEFAGADNRDLRVGTEIALTRIAHPGLTTDH
jgi:hypothetical protein